MLLRGDTGHGLEPVGEMGCASLHSPLFHGGCDHIGNGWVQGQTFIDGFFQIFVNRFRQSFSHHILSKYILTENLHFVHVLVFVL